MAEKLTYKETRIVYGVNCTWWDDIHKTSSRNFLPVCPHCGSVLMQVDNIKEWNAQVKKHEDDDNPGYFDFIKWLRGKCLPDYVTALDGFLVENPKAVFRFKSTRENTGEN